MSEDRLAADLFAARKRAIGESDKTPLSSMSPRIQRQYERFAAELRPVLAGQVDAAELERLREDSDILGALRAAGVDNWDGYGLALADFDDD